MRAGLGVGHERRAGRRSRRRAGRRGRRRRPRPRRARRSSRGTSRRLRRLGHLDLDALEHDTARAFGRVTSSSRTASTSAPSAIVPRDASSKCSRKCSGVKWDSAPSRTRDARHALGAVRAGDLLDLPHQVVHQRLLVHGSSSSQAAPDPRAPPLRCARRPPRPPASALRPPRSRRPRRRRRRRAPGSRPSARASSIASPTPNAWVEERNARAGQRLGRSRRSGAPCPARAPERDGVDDERARRRPPTRRAARLGSLLARDDLDARRRRARAARAATASPARVVAAAARCRRR